MTTVKAPIPANEEQRLAELRRYDILDTMPEDAYDDISKMASVLCDVPTVLVSLVDQDRQWFKSKVGIDAEQTDRDVAFCAHAIMEDTTMVVEDATKDVRFELNPLVTGELGLRFYAGAPLITPKGYALGTLCAIDYQPRQIKKNQVEALEALARQVTAQLELRLRIKELEAANHEIERNNKEYLKRLLETMQSSLIVVGADGLIENVNPATEHLLGYKYESLIGKKASEILPIDSFLRLDNDGSFELSPDASRTETVYHSFSGEEIPVLFTASVLTTDDGIYKSLVCSALDLRESKSLQARLLTAQKLEAIGQLAAGIAHEINTPIQFVGDNTRFIEESFSSLNALFDFVADVAACESSTSVNQLKDRALKLSQELDLNFIKEEVPLATQQSMEGIKRVTKIVQSMKEFSHPGTSSKQLCKINDLIASTVVVSSNEWKYVASLETDLDPSLQPLLCFPGEFNQVILNLIVNSAHALADKLKLVPEHQGKIKISTRLGKDSAVIEIEDNANGIPSSIIDKVFDPFFTTKEVGRGTGQGLAIAHNVIVEQHGGEIHVSSCEGIGTIFTITLPFESHEVGTQPSLATNNQQTGDSREGA